MTGAQRKSMSATPMPATILLIFSSRMGWSQCTLSVPRRLSGVSKSNLPGGEAAAASGTMFAKSGASANTLVPIPLFLRNDRRSGSGGEF